MSGGQIISDFILKHNCCWFFYVFRFQDTSCLCLFPRKCWTSYNISLAWRVSNLTLKTQVPLLMYVLFSLLAGHIMFDVPLPSLINSTEMLHWCKEFRTWNSDMIAFFSPCRTYHVRCSTAIIYQPHGNVALSSQWARHPHRQENHLRHRQH